MSTADQSSDLPFDEPQLRVMYRQRSSLYESLKEEAEFAIGQAIGEAGLKIHSISARVKDEQSFLEKVDRKRYVKPFEQTPDLVGVRIVCLFLSDLKKVDEILRKLFNPLKSEDKVHGEDASSFGYMSHHYECNLGDSYSGPRYNSIRNITFEVQCRTIAMDAWANISHYLAYKGEESIPPELRKDFFAISGLLYVADQHFELFFKEARKSGEATVASSLTGDKEHDILSLDALEVYLINKFPDRAPSDRSGVSDLFEELSRAGYSSLAKLNSDIERALPAVKAYEGEFKPNPRPGKPGKPGKFNSVGVVRIGLSIADPKFVDVRNELAGDARGGKLQEARYAKYRHLLRE